MSRLLQYTQADCPVCAYRACSPVPTTPQWDAKASAERAAAYLIDHARIAHGMDRSTLVAKQREVADPQALADTFQVWGRLD
jgi:hypothetical protein